MKVFTAYSHEDSRAQERLKVHLNLLHRQGLIEIWFDREIMAGSGLDEEISENLEACDLFLILVSPDFLASDYCYEQEMERALERRDEGTAIVIPVIVEPCEWQESPLRALKAVPYDGKPISKWDNQNDAYLDIVKEVRRVVNTQKMGIIKNT